MRFILILFLFSVGVRAGPLDSLRDCSTQLEACVAKNGHPADPYFMTHGHRTKYVALMIHGLGDSPYSMKDLARLVFDQGMNVVVIRLDGHGTKPEDLISVSLNNWIQNVDDGIARAQELGSHVVGVGYSTGAALLASKASASQVIEGLMLFSPAVKMVATTSYKACIPFIEKVMGTPWATDSGDGTPVKYGRTAINAVCQLYKLTKLIFFERGSISVPTLTMITAYDTTIDVKAQLEFVENLDSKVRQTVLFDNGVYNQEDLRKKIYVDVYPSKKQITHGGMTLETNEFVAQTNSSFPILEDELRKFISAQFK